MADGTSSTASAPLRKRFALRRSAKARRPGAITAVEFDAQMLRVAQLSFRGDGMTVSRAEVAPLVFPADVDRSDPVVLGQIISKALDTLHLRPGQVVMGVPRNLVVLRTLSLPATRDIREMASMVHMQIGKDLPFRQDEATIDFTVRREVAGNVTRDAEGEPKVDGSGPGKVEVLVAAIKLETAEFYRKVAAAAKFKLIALGWLSQGVARCAQTAGVADNEGAAALISLRTDEVGIDLVAGSLLFSHGAAIRVDVAPDTQNGGSAPVAEALASDAFVDAVTIEVVRSFHSYNGGATNPPVSKLVVVGSTGLEDRVAETLQKRVNLPCGRLNLAGGLDIDRGAGNNAEAVMAAIGLGLGVNDPEGLPYDFLNPKRPAVQRNIGRIRNLTFATAGLLLLIAILGLRSHLVGQRLKQNEEVQKQLTQAEKQLPTYRRMRQQAAAVQKWVNDGRNWLEQYAYLSAVLPGCDDLYITSLSVSGQGAIHLAVQAKSGEILANLDKQLRAAGFEIKPLAITPGSDRHGYNFRTTVELIVPPKMKIDLAKAHPPARPADDGSLDPKSRPGRKRGRP